MTAELKMKTDGNQMKAKHIIIIALMLALSVLAGTFAGSACLSTKNSRIESAYVAGCAIHAHYFRMEAKYIKTQSGMPLAYFTFVRYARACAIVDYMNYVVNDDKFWKADNPYGTTQEAQIKAKQKLNELFGGAVTIQDVLERSYDVEAFLNELPYAIKTEIIDDGGTQNENRY